MQAHLCNRGWQICAHHGWRSHVLPQHAGAAACRLQRRSRRRSVCKVTSGAAAALHPVAVQGNAALAAAALHPHVVVPELSEGLEVPIQLIYLVTLLGFLVVGAYLVVRQVLVQRELEEAAKTLGDRVRQSNATAEDYFELGVILLRKKLFTQATKNLEKAKKTWGGEPDELAQVHNALGFAYFSMERNELAVRAYRQAVELQPGYVTAWNNLGNAYEKTSEYVQALKAYEEALSYAPENQVARAKAEQLRSRVERRGL